MARREEDVLGEGRVTCEIQETGDMLGEGRESCLCREQGGETTVGKGAITALGRGLLQPTKPELRATETPLSLFVLIAGARLCPSKDAVSNILFLTSSPPWYIGELLLLLLIFIFSWRILAFQCCVSFCHTTT